MHETVPEVVLGVDIDFPHVDRAEVRGVHAAQRLRGVMKQYLQILKPEVVDMRVRIEVSGIRSEVPTRRTLPIAVEHAIDAVCGHGPHGLFRHVDASAITRVVRL